MEQINRFFGPILDAIARFFGLDDPKVFTAVLAARYLRLGLLIVKMPATYFFLLVFALSWMQGFQPIPFLSTTFDGWLRGIGNGVFLTWTCLFIGFVQRLDNYKVDSFDKSIQGIEAKGNKHWTVYGLGVVVWLVMYGLESWIAHGATTWFFLVCAFLQILPLLLGNSLVEQAKHLAPKFANWTLIVTAMWLISVGVHP